MLLPRILLVLAIASGLGSLVVFGLNRPQKIVVAPRMLEVDPRQIFFPEAKQGDELKGSFTLRSNAPGSIEILRIISSCSCSTMTEDKFTLSSKEEKKIDFVWKVGSSRHQTKTGFTIHYRVEDKEYMTLVECHVYVRPDIEYTPKEIRFMHGPEHTDTQKLEISFTPGLLNMIT